MESVEEDMLTSDHQRICWTPASVINLSSSRSSAEEEGKDAFLFNVDPDFDSSMDQGLESLEGFGVVCRNTTSQYPPPMEHRLLQTPSADWSFGFIMKTVIVPTICAVGMAGNLLTLLVLSRKRLKVICDGIERTIHLGLRALAVSDLLLCVCLLPNGFIEEERFEYSTRSFQLVYRVYSGAVINTFILTSTWLTVTMATSRYLAICFPFRWHHLVGMTGTKASITMVFLVCLVLNIPRFFENSIATIPCSDGRMAFIMHPGELQISDKVANAYAWVYFVVGIFLPLTALTFCNFCLVKTLRESSRVRQQYRVRAYHVNMNHRITVILVTIVLMYIVLVSPAEILLFVQGQLSKATVGPLMTSIKLAVNITNVLQTVNFSLNFVLYIMLNFQFRRTIEDLFCGCRRRWCTAATKRKGGVQRVVFLARHHISLKTINSSVYSAAVIY